MIILENKLLYPVRRPVYISMLALLLCVLNMTASTAQATARPDSLRSFFTLHLGGGLSGFNRDQGLSFGRFDRDALRAWRAGMTIGLLNKRWYQMRLEAGYVLRGAREVFSDGSFRVNSTARLQYAQATWFPAVLKLGSRRAGAFAGVGGYGGYLIKGAANFTMDGKKITFNTLPETTFKKYDYGLSAGIGAYFKNHLLEIRLENGLTPAYSYENGEGVYNRSLNLILHL